jgi:hypothetical protein
LAMLFPPKLVVACEDRVGTERVACFVVFLAEGGFSCGEVVLSGLENFAGAYVAALTCGASANTSFVALASGADPPHKWRPASIAPKHAKR